MRLFVIGMKGIETIEPLASSCNYQRQSAKGSVQHDYRISYLGFLIFGILSLHFR